MSCLATTGRPFPGGTGAPHPRPYYNCGMNTQIPHHRHSIRLKGYDYTLAGAYFVTLVTHNRQAIFGKVESAQIHLNVIGKIAEREWLSIPDHFQFVQLGEFVIMPNHLHAVIVFNDRDIDVGATQPKPSERQSGKSPSQISISSGKNGSPRPESQRNRPAGPASGSLGAIIGQFKSRVTKRLWQLPDWQCVPIWQGNYYEHIIRDEVDYNNIILYIQANPANWMNDEENSNPFP